MTARKPLLAAALAFLAAQDFRAGDLAAQEANRPLFAAAVRLGVLRSGAYDVATVALETYVSRVLAGEAARDSPPAALEALAIAIRTFALANLGRHRADGFDLCDQTHCQVARTATAATDRAAAATAGVALLFNGQPASIFYSASCGGRTERPSAVWPGAVDPPYLPTRPDDACEGRPEWIADLAVDDLQRALTGVGYRGRLRRVAIRSRNQSGRVASVRLDGLTPDEISGQDLRMALARTPRAPQIQSATFDLEQNGGRYRFAGRGAGHGVGLCVIGSVRLAAGGGSAAAILQRYFPGTVLSSRAPAIETAAPAGEPPAPAVEMSAEDEARARLTELVAVQKEELARALGIPAPLQVSARVHRAPGDYERATGRPWFTLGAVVQGEVHLLPLASLRSRGMLERTVRRQLARLLTEPSLGGKPLWVREGLALHFGDLDDPAASGSGSRAACPTDEELLRPVSPGALADAYARARSCVARQLASGRSWKEVR